MLKFATTSCKKRVIMLWHWYERAMLHAEFGDGSARTQQTTLQSSHLDTQHRALRTP